MTEHDLRPELGHLDESTWERLACGELGPAERRAAFDHITRCASCRRILRAVEALHEGAQKIDPEAPRRGPWSHGPTTRSARQVWLWAAAAAAVAVACLAVLLLPPPTVPTAAIRGEVPAAAEPVEPIGKLSRAPAALRWQPAAGARGYRVEMLDADAEPLWTSRTVTATALPWPDEVAATPGTYYWRVLAMPAEGGPPRSSSLVRFDLGPPG